MEGKELAQALEQAGARRQTQVYAGWNAIRKSGTSGQDRYMQSDCKFDLSNCCSILITRAKKERYTCFSLMIVPKELHSGHDIFASLCFNSAQILIGCH